MIEIPTWYPVAGLVLTIGWSAVCFAAGFCKGLKRGNQITQRKRRFGSAEDY
ncbi:hypothetical protein TSACC_21675 [Terrimicrobium sacchariphilum]|uniref:Uncharacterized protein n=1 Tax=Terrimicrobium sacchariphilum TaxID=690879 RepID=A0A146G7C5_TERSA|nr:hypothetical protein [Terrimicrobium sacchariphilum]GAT33262.1 hypothetical protein TSACC_21675 [Terrimicrobium sacchariphilum]